MMAANVFGVGQVGTCIPWPITAAEFITKCSSIDSKAGFVRQPEHMLKLAHS
jgi:hypothetical protein